MHKSGDLLRNIVNGEEWKVIMIDDEHDQLIISHGTDTKFITRVVNISNLDVDYCKV